MAIGLAESGEKICSKIDLSIAEVQLFLRDRKAICWVYSFSPAHGRHRR
jgi:hypothetical protein